MQVVFEEEYLKELYESGKASDKRHRFQPEIIKKYIRCIDVLISANSPEDLYPFHSLNYKILEGDKANISSIRVNDKYRIEFTVTEAGTEPVISVCNILQLTNHYR